MLAMSPLFSSTFGWPLEDHNTQNLQQNCNSFSIEVEENSYHSLVDFGKYDEIQQEFPPENSVSGGCVNGDITDPMLMVKKLHHNASERHRRKRVNDLYAFLRSLLPMSSHQKKKVSIPGLVSHALKYIPELQKEVETLTHKKEKLSLSKAKLRQEFAGIIKNHNGKEATLKSKSSVVSSVRVLGEKEIVIQLISPPDHVGILSMVLEFLEQEEDGFVLKNATTFRCSGEGMLLNTLHLQVQDDNVINAERLMEKLCSFHQQLHRI